MNNILNELKVVVLDGFEQDYYHGNSEGVFKSHFDWHSSVHAHWMLLSSSRVSNDQVTVKKILNRLNQLALEKERERLLADPDFELPYGQAWLLLLLHELGKHAAVHRESLRLQKETAQRIINWLHRVEFPEETDGAYHSWLFSYFLLKKSQVTDFSEQIKNLDKKFNLISGVRDEDNPKDFFSSESLFRLLTGSAKADLPLTSVLMRELQRLGPITFNNCHVIGKTISKSWLMPSIQKDAYNESINFVEGFLEEPRFWKDDFQTVSHWIPQFLWFGIWLSLGEP